MQLSAQPLLDSPRDRRANQKSIRGKLRGATVALLSCAAAGSAADFGTPWTADGALLVYSESGRVTVVEPVIQVKRDFSDGKFLTARYVFDTMTGASPVGATATNRVQTFTTPSGNTTKVAPGETPLRDFHDQRSAGDVSYATPVTRYLKTTIGGSASSETDYSSLGLRSSWSYDLDQRRSTLTAGVGFNSDHINPVGGKPLGLGRVGAHPTVETTESKQVADFLIGTSRVLSRRWLMLLNYSYGSEHGYLTEPYKMISEVDGVTGETPAGSYRYEKRPDNRIRQSIFAQSIYHLARDVVRVSYRYYFDDWGIRSHTVDLKYSWNLGRGVILQPHTRWYRQSAADFYTYRLIRGDPLPDYASADYRLGDMTTLTFGAKLGIPVMENVNLNIRTEYMRQSGDSHPDDAIGIQKDYDLFPAIDAMIISAGLSIGFTDLQ